MIAHRGIKCTAVQFAKLVVWERGEAAPYWSDDEDTRDAMTPREHEAVVSAITRQMDRVERFLGVRAVRRALRR